MNLPNFIVIGAAKSGTTSVWSYLKQHPQVFMSKPKEPNFFIFEGVKLPYYSGPDDEETLIRKLYQGTITDFETYQTLFQDVGEARAIGEASVRYLYFPQAAERIKKYIPDAKMIIMLRNPVNRLYSQYVMNVRDLLEPLPLSEAITAEDERISKNWDCAWHYTKLSSYYNQVKFYLDLFSPQQIKVIIYEYFCRDTVGIMQELYRFIDVDDSFIPNCSKSNSGYWPKSFLIHRLLKEPNAIKLTLEKALPRKTYNKALKFFHKSNKGAIPPIPTTVKDDLKQLFRKDILNLQELLGRQIPWLTDEI
ncbi:MAG: sulfotransferase [Okeania sp. SIO3H1]|nr:sulfotransferase [Okeania sp. SIO3H1]